MDIQRWAKWPFHPPPEPPPPPPWKRRQRKAVVPLVPPIELDAPVASKIEARALEVSWEEHPRRHESDDLLGYELEVAEVCLLDGMRPWSQAAFVYPDTPLVHTIKRLLPETEVPRPPTRLALSSPVRPSSACAGACARARREPGGRRLVEQRACGPHHARGRADLGAAHRYPSGVVHARHR